MSSGSGRFSVLAVLEERQRLIADEAGQRRALEQRLPGDTASIAASNRDARYHVRPDGHGPLRRAGSSGGASHASRPAAFTYAAMSAR